MKYPQTPEDLKEEILISSDKYDKVGDLRIRQLIQTLFKVDHEIIVEGILRVFESNRINTYFRDQEFAGMILKTIKPKTKKDLEEILKRTLFNWDKSVEELPFWILENYGLDKIKNVIDKITLNEIEREKLKTIDYWIKINAASA